MARALSHPLGRILASCLWGPVLCGTSSLYHGPSFVLSGCTQGGDTAAVKSHCEVGPSAGWPWGVRLESLPSFIPRGNIFSLSRVDAHLSFSPSRIMLFPFSCIDAPLHTSMASLKSSFIHQYAHLVDVAFVTL